MLTIDFGADGVVVIVGRLDAAQSPAVQAFLDRDKAVEWLLTQETP